MIRWTIGPSISATGCSSLRIIDGKPCFVDAHWALITGAGLLVDLPKNLDRTSFERYIELVQRTGHTNALPIHLVP